MKAGDQHKGHARLGHINRAVNLAIRSVKTSTIQTPWTSPLEALGEGFGDCKQIALLKYAALAEAGFSPNDIRLVIVKIKALHNEPHAMIAVREDARWSILDSRTMAIVESTKLLGYYEPNSPSTIGEFDGLSNPFQWSLYGDKPFITDFGRPPQRRSADLV